MNDIFKLILLIICVAMPQLGLAADTRIENDRISTGDGILLSAIWTIPTKQDVSFIALIIPGSGNVGTNGDVSSPFVGFGYGGQKANLSEQLADKLAENGIGSLRYAKRGFEDPTQLANQTIPYLKSDAEAALKLIKTKYPKLKILLVGFSEGATISTMIAAERSDIEYLFLMAPPTRNISDIIEYQFKTWGEHLAKVELDKNSDGKIDLEELRQRPDATLPLVGPGFLPARPIDLDRNHDGVLSIATEIVPAYEATHTAAKSLLQQDAFRSWYESMLKVPEFFTLAPKVRATVFIYEGQKDPQLNPEWIELDRKYFLTETHYYKFKDLGHCFAPLDGNIDEIKTSGPLDNAFLTIFGDDLESLTERN